jgi:TatD DNase family protein
MNKIIDTHCHLDFDNFDIDRDEVLERAINSGVKNIVVPAIDLSSCHKVISLAEKYESIYAAVGIHPNSSATWQPSWLAQIKNLANHDKVVAIGEIGLDYYRDYSPRSIQVEAFRDQVNLAAEIGLPVIVHNRDSDDDLLEILLNSNLVNSPRPGVLHSFSSKTATANEALDSGFYIGFTGPITFKNAAGLRQVVKMIPLDRILLETDAPFLAPQAVRGKRNEPSYLRHTAEKMGEILGLDYAEIAIQTTKNAEYLFGLPILPSIS